MDCVTGTNPQKKLCGIYSITHKVSGRKYIGSSVDIYKRFIQHKSDSKKRAFTCFSRALLEYGLDAFEFSVVEECEPSQLLDREKFYINLFNTASEGGFNTRANPVAYYGLRHSPATRERMRIARTGLKRGPMPQAVKDKISAAHKGKKMSESFKMKLRESMTGKKASLETRLKMSAAMRGRKWTPEHCKAISDGKRGIPFSPEARANFRLLRAEKKLSKPRKKKTEQEIQTTK